METKSDKSIAISEANSEEDGSSDSEVDILLRMDVAL